VDRYGLPARTEQTITEEAALREELSKIRQQGYATSEHEAALGVQSVAAPVHHRGTVLGAVSVSGTSNQIGDDDFETELPELVTDAAAALADRYADHHD
jgi:DNA-binding IclR family transcriptional regulator